MSATYGLLTIRCVPRMIVAVSVIMWSILGKQALCRRIVIVVNISIIVRYEFKNIDRNLELFFFFISLEIVFQILAIANLNYFIEFPMSHKITVYSRSDIRISLHFVLA